MIVMFMIIRNMMIMLLIDCQCQAYRNIGLSGSFADGARKTINGGVYRRVFECLLRVMNDRRREP